MLYAIHIVLGVKSTSMNKDQIAESITQGASKTQEDQLGCYYNIQSYHLYLHFKKTRTSTHLRHHSYYLVCSYTEVF